jgi:hypothetical protein
MITILLIVLIWEMFPKCGGFFYILSQHLDHLEQLDNLKHSAHLYGQLTTAGCFTTFGQFTTI